MEGEEWKGMERRVACKMRVPRQRKANPIFSWSWALDAGRAFSIMIVCTFLCLNSVVGS